MICAPLLITTLNRDIHFIRLIESLKKNSWAKYTPVYIALDYPPSAKYIDGYNKISKYLEGDFSMFMEFNVYRRKENYGSARNMLELREEVLRKYDRFIRTDDDAEFSPNFLEYMNKCLDKYECDSNVIAVSGYSYPVKWNVSENATVLKENFICPMWGTGFWRDKYVEMFDFIKKGGLGQNTDYVLKRRLYKSMSDRCKFEYVNLCLGPDFETSLAHRLTDISIRMYTAIYNKCVVIPIISKVRNWGFDGTGEYCGKVEAKGSSKVTAYEYDYCTQYIDKSFDFELIEDTNYAIDCNLRKMNQFDYVSKINKIKLYAKFQLYRMFGKERINKFMLKFRKC